MNGLWMVPGISLRASLQGPEAWGATQRTHNDYHDIIGRVAGHTVSCTCWVAFVDDAIPTMMSQHWNTFHITEYWSFVRGIHWSPVYSLGPGVFPSQRTINVMWSFGVFSVIILNNLLNKNLSHWWFKTSSSCYDTVVHKRIFSIKTPCAENRTKVYFTEEAKLSLVDSLPRNIDEIWSSNNFCHYVLSIYCECVL